jgi:hypothetical protein
MILRGCNIATSRCSFPQDKLTFTRDFEWRTFYTSGLTERFPHADDRTWRPHHTTPSLPESIRCVAPAASRRWAVCRSSAWNSSRTSSAPPRIALKYRVLLIINVAMCKVINSKSCVDKEWRFYRTWCVCVCVCVCKVNIFSEELYASIFRGVREKYYIILKRRPQTPLECCNLWPLQSYRVS